MYFRKVTRLKKRVIKLIQSKKKEYDRKEKLMESFEDNPLMIFDELQYERDIIPDLLASVDDSLLLEYQSWQYPFVYKSLINNFKVAPLVISWDEEVFPSPFYLLSNGYPVVAIHPYKQTFEVLPSEEFIDILAEFERVSKARIDKWVEYQTLLIHEWNPYIGTGESMSAALKVMLTKGKKTKELKMQQELVLSEHEAYVDSCNRQMLKIESESRTTLLENYELDNLYNELRIKLPLRYVNLHDQIIFETTEMIAKWENEAEEQIARLQKEANETEQY